jgi:Predicted pPIWI-associating nuclease
MTRMVQSLERLNLQPTDLEWLKKQEIVSQLEAEGYKVVDAQSGPDIGFDLMATKGQKKLAVEIKSSTRLPDAAEEIKSLRERALEMGLDEFRVILVSPPRQRDVEIDGLDERLLAALSEDVPQELHDLAPNIIIEDISDLDIESLEVTEDVLRVKGDAVIDTLLEYGGGEEKDGMNVTASLPFTFDIELDHDLSIEKVHKIKIDTSGWD